MNLFEGLEKLGLGVVQSMDNLFEEEKKKKEVSINKTEEILTEESFLLEKKIVVLCVIRSLNIK